MLSDLNKIKLPGIGKVSMTWFGISIIAGTSVAIVAWNEYESCKVPSGLKVRRY